MIRPMTSSVSTLSSFLAKSHQAIHFVSSTPSKIPYGGFSPVRLQTRFRPRPPSRAGHRQLIGRHCLYLRSRRLFRSGTHVQSAPRTSDQDHGSNGPWLPNRFYCPVGSSLTMATSAPLSATRAAYELFRQAAGSSPPTAEGPQFTLPIPSPHAVALTPVVPTIAFDDAFIAGCAFATSLLARQPQGPPIRNGWVV